MNQDSRMTTLLIDFPEDVLLKICTNWLSLKALCRLDSATCIKDKRAHFLQAIGSKNASFNNSAPTSPSSSTKGSPAHTISTKCFQWITQRQLSIEHLTLSKDVDGPALELSLDSPKAFRKIRSLSFSAGPKLPETSVVTIAKQCSELEAFSMSGFKKATEVKVSGIVERSPNLLTLSLVGCWMVSDDDVKRVTESCKKLESIDLSTCFNITDEALLSIAQNCRNLHTLALSHCAGVTDKGISEIAKQCRKLRHVNLSTCINVSDEGISSLAQYSTLLQVADLSYLKLVTDASVIQIVARCPALQELHLEGCSNITNALVERVALDGAKSCTKLTALNVRYCQKITAEVLADFRAAHKAITLQSTVA